jgi:hypothetical protein
MKLKKLWLSKSLFRSTEKKCAGDATMGAPAPHCSGSPASKLMMSETCLT